MKKSPNSRFFFGLRGARRALFMRCGKGGTMFRSAGLTFSAKECFTFVLKKSAKRPLGREVLNWELVGREGIFGHLTCLWQTVIAI